MFSDWRLLHPRDLREFPFCQPTAHTKCLKLFAPFAETQRRLNSEENDLPTNMTELIRALELHRAYNFSSCQKCSYGSRTVRMAHWAHRFFGAWEAFCDKLPWVPDTGTEVYCADPFGTTGLHTLLNVTLTFTLAYRRKTEHRDTSEK